jgi:hypothetical protein
VRAVLHIIAFIAALFTPDADADALRATAPDDLTIETARLHLANARIAAATSHVDADLLLSIAWHESRYVVAARTAEPLGKTSCGVMTPVPKATCTTPTMLEGYLEGAAHLREWLEAAHGNEHVALLGYAGGYRMINACAEGPVMVVRNNQDVDLCTVASIFQWRARLIRRGRAHRQNVSS